MSVVLSVLDSRVMLAAFHFGPHNLVRSVTLLLKGNTFTEKRAEILDLPVMYLLLNVTRQRTGVAQWA